MVLYMPRARQQSFYSASFFVLLGFSTTTTITPAHTLLGYIAISEGKRFSQDTSRAHAFERS